MEKEMARQGRVGGKRRGSSVRARARMCAIARIHAYVCPLSRECEYRAIYFVTQNNFYFKWKYA